MVGGRGRILNILTLMTFILVDHVAQSTFGEAGVGGHLRAEYLSRKLPSVLYLNEAIYNGDDAIYLFGGLDYAGNTRQILRFNVFSETVEIIGELPAGSGGGYYGGSVQQDGLGNMYYIGGDGGTNVVRFDPISNKSSVVGSTPYDLRFSDSVKYQRNENESSSSNVYIFGGDGQPNPTATGVLRFDMDTGVLEAMGNLPSGTGIYGLSCGRVGRNAYLFGGIESRSFFQVDLVTFDVLESPVDMMPFMSHNGRTVVAGGDVQYVYTVGGYLPTMEFRTDGIIQFYNGGLGPTFIPVEDFRVGRDNNTFFSVAPSVVFVEKLNRLYFFGGRAGDLNGGFIALDDIWFIDLDPLEAQRQRQQVLVIKVVATDVSESTIQSIHPHPHPRGMIALCSSSVLGDCTPSSLMENCPLPLLKFVMAVYFRKRIKH